MARRRALLSAMRITGGLRLPWTGARALGQRLADEPVQPDGPNLARLLSAAAGPARPHELAGEQAVLDAYCRAGRSTATPVRPPAVPLVTLTRALAVKVAAAAAVLSIGSAALAAQTGHLPSGAQQAAHDLFSSWGVPAPAKDDPRHRDPPGPGDGQPDGASTPAPGPPGGPRAGTPGPPPATPPGGRPASGSPAPSG